MQNIYVAFLSTDKIDEAKKNKIRSPLSKKVKCLFYPSFIATEVKNDFICWST